MVNHRESECSKPGQKEYTRSNLKEKELTDM